MVVQWPWEQNPVVDCSAPEMVTLPVPLVAAWVCTCVERSLPLEGVMVTLPVACVAPCPPVVVVSSVPLMVSDPLAAAPAELPPGSSTSASPPRPSLQLLRCLPASSG